MTLADERQRNFDVMTAGTEYTERLAAIQGRMTEAGYPEQKIQDVVELARLRILGSKLKKYGHRKVRGAWRRPVLPDTVHWPALTVFDLLLLRFLVKCLWIITIIV